MSTGLSDWHKRASAAYLDQRLGVDTAGRIDPDQLDITPEQKHSAVQYQPTELITFVIVLSRLGIEYSRYTFVDDGSGKGRALVLAAQFPFRRIIEMEISSVLHQTASENLRGFVSTKKPKCRDIISICDDATTFPVPVEPLVAYFYHSFAPQVLAHVLRNMFASLQLAFRHIILVYQHGIGQPEPGKPLHAPLTPTFDKAAFLRPTTLRVGKAGWDVYETVSAVEFADLTSPGV
jgi:hypothetical protein